MKKIIMMIVLGSSLAQAKSLVCESVDHSDRCNDVVTQFELDLVQNTFTYANYYQMKFAKGCGWPPAGYMTSGRLKQIDAQSYELEASDIGGIVKYDGKNLIYSAISFHEIELNCMPAVQTLY